MLYNDKLSPAFVQDDLIVQYTVSKGINTAEKYNSYSLNYYIIIYNIYGTCKLIVNNTPMVLKSGEALLTNKGVSVKTARTSKGKSLSIFFLPSAIKGTEDDFLRVFYENNFIIYNIDKFERSLCLSALQSLYHCIFENQSRFEFLLRLKIIISEINFFYDKSIHRKPPTKDNLTVTVIEYIENNYTENIKLKTLEEKFFISDKTINRMCKIMRGCTFHKLLTDLRLQQAERFMETKKKSLYKVAQLSGFQSYQSFFRAYKAKHGKSPYNDQSDEKFYWPFNNK